MARPNLFIEINSVCDAAGSSSWSLGGAHVVASVYGPQEATLANELTHRACIDLSVLPVSGRHSPYESDVECYLTDFVERLIDTKDYPRCQFIIRIQIVSGVVGHPETMAACVNALSLSLLQANIVLTASVVAVCTSEVDSKFRPVTVMLDVTHPLLSSTEQTLLFLKPRIKNPDAALVFGIYFGRAICDPSLLHITPSLLLELSSSKAENSSSPLDVNALHSRAADLFGVMLKQLTARATEV